ncbi:MULTISPECIES: hypothetical protein [Paenibacillus]|uniref:hypothetical protein n=1 Tax=Paenibacillus TaxID=44249 RepID=UPI0007E37FAD|nr:hypothetical protein [Paenibacillus sp. AD87]OAX50810.1 hypothetical protein gpAD87_21635 [Paenibacillus sp. AD87]
MNMRPNNLNGSEDEATKRRAEELARQAKGSSLKSGIITTLVLAVIIIGIFYGIAYFRTN